jgi:7,8-dihydropterin-6-yl-methyl-4-(beta-D-ribofuranosyl)aminobenzene 5'-phosphate synthase
MRQAGTWIIVIFITFLELSLNTTVVFGSVFSLDRENMRMQYTMNTESKHSSTDHNKDVSITVIYDNNAYGAGLETGWGFSCLIRGHEKAVLFDTGGDGSKLLANMKKLGISPVEIDMVVLSHIHGDHVGGLTRFLEKNPNVTVFVPKSFPGDFKRDIKNCGAKVVEVQKSMKICEDMYSTGELGAVIKEQSLIVKTDRGLIVITGCAHPGIVNVVKKTKGLFKDTVLFVMGGYHLGSKNRRELDSIISDLRNLGVQYVGPCHCTGEKARELFKKTYREKYIPVGVGKIIDMGSLQ